MKRTTIRLQVIKVYDVVVTHDDDEDPIAKVYNDLSATQIETRFGKLSHTEVDHGEVWDQQEIGPTN